LIAVYGLFMTPIGWRWALLVWGYALAWFFFNDRVKLVAQQILAANHSGMLTKAGLRQKPA
jgi:H+-transporting ATPase